jgi:hypothetical protein
MRAALLVIALAVASLLGSVDAWTKFDCFETPGEGRRCACVGAGNCSEMKSSDSCKSDPECDKSELGAIICSCKAVRTTHGPLSR